MRQLSPIPRFRKYLERVHGWSESDEKALQQACRRNVLEALAEDDKLARPKLIDLFTDVYDTLPSHLQEQKEELKEILAKPAGAVLRREAERHRDGFSTI